MPSFTVLSEHLEAYLFRTRFGRLLSKATLWNDLAVGDDREQAFFTHHPDHAPPTKRQAFNDLADFYAAIENPKLDLTPQIHAHVTANIDAVLTLHHANIRRRAAWYSLFVCMAAFRFYTAVRSLHILGKGALITREVPILMRVLSEPKTAAFGPFSTDYLAFRVAEDKVMYGSFNTLAVLAATTMPSTFAAHRSVFSAVTIAIAGPGFIILKALINGRRWARNHALKRYSHTATSDPHIAALEARVCKAINDLAITRADTRPSHGARQARRLMNRALGDLRSSLNLANGVQDNTPNTAFWEKAALSAITLPLLAFYMSAVGIDPTIAGFAVLLTLHNLERSLEDLFNPHVTAAQAEQTFGTNVSNIMIQDLGIILPTWINENSF